MPAAGWEQKARSAFPPLLEEQGMDTPADPGQCQGSAMVGITSSSPGSRVELQSREGLDVIHHAATPCLVLLPG